MTIADQRVTQPCRLKALTAHRRGSCALLAGAGLVAAATLVTIDASAYCRTSVCAGNIVGKVCEPPEGDDCGLPLYWAKRCVGYSVQEDASRQVPWDVANQVTTDAFTTWGNADCGGGQGPTIEGVDLGPVQCEAREYNSSGGNANIIVFRDESWPYAGQWNTLALTTVTYNLDTGEIYDADLEVNGTDVELTWGDTDVQYDLPSIVTHEVGHMLGLAHSSEPDATMFSDYQLGDTSLRDLDQDDVDAICTVYPPGPPRADLPCDPEPRHGFKTTCGPGPDEEEGCSCGTPGKASGTMSPLALLLLIACRLRRGGRASAPRRGS